MASLRITKGRSMPSPTIEKIPAKSNERTPKASPLKEANRNLSSQSAINFEQELSPYKRPKNTDSGSSSTAPLVLLKPIMERNSTILKEKLKLPLFTAAKAFSNKDLAIIRKRAIRAYKNISIHLRPLKTRNGASLVEAFRFTKLCKKLEAPARRNDIRRLITRIIIKKGIVTDANHMVSVFYKKGLEELAPYLRTKPIREYNLVKNIRKANPTRLFLQGGAGQDFESDRFIKAGSKHYGNMRSYYSLRLKELTLLNLGDLLRIPPNFHKRWNNLEIFRFDEFCPTETDPTEKYLNLFNILKELPNLKEIMFSLQENADNPEIYKAFADCLHSLPKLNKLGLSMWGSNPQSPHAPILFEQIEKLKLKDLVLNINWLTLTSEHVVPKYLSEEIMHPLKAIKLEFLFQEYSENFVSKLCRTLNKANNLQRFSMVVSNILNNGSSVTTFSFTPILKELNGLTQLESFVFAGLDYELVNEDITMLAALVRRNPKLKEFKLVVSNGVFTPAKISPTVEFFQSLPATIRNLEFTHLPKVNSQDLDSIVRSFRRNSQIEHINIGFGTINLTPAEAAMFVCQALAELRYLKSLKINWNAFEIDKAFNSKIISLVRGHRTCTSIVFQGVANGEAWRKNYFL